MILKFDHISYSCEYSQEKQLFSRGGLFENYKIKFVERDLPNVQGKLSLLNCMWPVHDILFCECDGCIPVEVVLYKSCFKGNSCLKLQNNIIHVCTSKVSKTINLLTLLGFKKNDNLYVFESRLDKMRVFIRLEEVADKVVTKLDEIGYTSLAMWSTNGVVEHKKFIEYGFRVYDKSQIYINGKKINVFFVTDGQGLIVEILSLR